MKLRLDAALARLWPVSGTPNGLAHQEAARDELTGLLTRQALYAVALNNLTRSGSQPASFAAMSLDMDYFKQINDTVGHQAGDTVLKETAQRIRAAVRSEDLVARVGGDEFVILMPDLVSETAILNVADRVLNAASRPIVNEKIELFPSLTIGIAISEGSGQASFDEVLHRSDLALLQAKLISRGTVHFFDRNMEGELVRRRKIEQELRSAVSAGQLRLHYQPIYDIRRSRVTHLEALVRWQHPELGLVPPGDFIAIAEAGGIIQSIGVWVMAQAFSDLDALDRAGCSDIAITVNLSPEQLKLTSFVRGINEIASSHPGRNHRLALEVTEDVVIDDRYQMNAKLEALREAGFRIYLDDFGTGNASIGRLRKFRFNGIKIDRSLITNLERDPSDLGILRSILMLADSLGVTAIAEGVETRACLDLIIREGCRYAQGFLFSRPQPLEDILGLVRDQAATSHLAEALRTA